MRNNIEFIDLMNNEILRDYEKVFKKILKRVKKELKIHGKLGLSVTLCDDEHIQELNKTYRNKNSATDVLSFAIEDNSDVELLEKIKNLTSVREIGDIIISYDKAQSQAKEYGHSLYREICFLYTHGVLHLLGYDHINKSDEDISFAIKREKPIMKKSNFSRYIGNFTDFKNALDQNFLADIPQLIQTAKAVFIENYPLDETIRMFVDFQMEEIDEESLLSCFTVDTLSDVTPKRFLEELKLCGISIDGNTECIMDFCLDKDITDALLVVHFGQNMEILDIAHES